VLVTSARTVLLLPCLTFPRDGVVDHSPYCPSSTASLGHIQDGELKQTVTTRLAPGEYPSFFRVLFFPSGDQCRSFSVLLLMHSHSIVFLVPFRSFFVSSSGLVFPACCNHGAWPQSDFPAFSRSYSPAERRFPPFSYTSAFSCPHPRLRLPVFFLLTFVRESLFRFVVLSSAPTSLGF